MAERLLRQPRVLFRVDGSTAMGMGHVYRSLAIADALRELSRADIAFLMSADHTEGLITVSRRGYPVRVVGDGRLDNYLEHIRDFSPEILINDLPTVEAAYMKALSHVGATTVNLVDTAGGPGDGRALRAGDRLGDEPGPRDPGGLLRRARLRDPPRAVPRPGEGGAREAAHRAAELRGQRPPGPDLEGGAGARRPRPRDRGRGGGGRRVLVPEGPRRPGADAAPPGAGDRRRRRPHLGADAGGRRDGGIGRDVGVRDRRPRALPASSSARTCARTAACASSRGTAPSSTSASARKSRKRTSRARSRRCCGTRPGGGP